MAKRTRKTSQDQSQPAPAAQSAPAAASPEATDANRLINAAFDEITAVRARRSGLAKLEAKVAKQKAKLQALDDEYAAAEAEVAQAEADVIARYPKAAEMLGKTVAKRGRKPGGKRAGGQARGRRGGGNTLSLEQAGQVLAAMPAEFELGAYNKKAREMFSGSTAKGAMKLLKDEVKKLGGKGMGMKYRKV